MSSDSNHRRKNRPRPSLRYERGAYRNGFPTADPGSGNLRGRHGYLAKVQCGSSVFTELSNRHISACSGFDSSNGHRGMARQVAGAKKYVRTRTRFHENAATKRLAREPSED